MRSLIYACPQILVTLVTLVTFAMLVSLEILGAENQIQFYLRKQTDPTIPFQTTDAPELKSKSFQTYGLTLQGPVPLTWAKTSWWDLGLSLDWRKNDYSSYIIRLPHGTEKTLKELNAKENEVRLGVYGNIYWGHFLLALKVSQEVTKGPFQSQNFDLKLIYKLFNDQILPYFKVTSQHQDRPLDTFVTIEDSSEHLRPRHVDTRRYELGYEQIATEHLKYNLAFLFGEKSQERPDHKGAQLKVAYALAPLWHVLAQCQKIEENRTRPLKNERGYFDYSDMGLKLTYEPVYDLLISLGYLLSKEQERGDLFHYQEGTDTYSLAVDLPLASWYESAQGSLNVSASYSRSNIKRSILSLSGGYTWNANF